MSKCFSRGHPLSTRLPGHAALSRYRIYVLTPQERISDARECEYEDDQAALAAAQVLRGDRYAVEIWSGERLVDRIGAEFSL